MISGSIVALVTPMHEDGSIDFACLERLIDWHIEQGTHGVVIAGTTGESATLGKEEHVEVIRVAAARAGGRISVVAGTGSNSTQQTIDLSLAVAKTSIEAYLLVVPYYNKPTQEGMYLHFRSIADALDKPVILYNVPGRTVVDLQPATVGRLSQHPLIMGIKEATGDLARVAVLRRQCGENFVLLSGDDETAGDFMLIGGNGVISVTANAAPRKMVEMCVAAVRGDKPLTAALNSALMGLHRSLFVESNPIPVKWALHRCGRISQGIRLPLTELSRQYHGAVEAALSQAGVL